MPECFNYAQINGCLQADGSLCPHVDLPIEDRVARFRMPLIICSLTGQELTDANIGSIPEILAENADTFLGGGGAGIGMLFEPKEKG